MNFYAFILLKSLIKRLNCHPSDSHMIQGMLSQISILQHKTKKWLITCTKCYGLQTKIYFEHTEANVAAQVHCN